MLRLRDSDRVPEEAKTPSGFESEVSEKHKSEVVSYSEFSPGQNLG